MKGDRRRTPTALPGAGDAYRALSWSQQCSIDDDDGVRGESSRTVARSLARALVDDPACVFERSTSALQATTCTMGAMTAPLLDPRVGVELMRLHHVFDDIRLARALRVREGLDARAVIASHEPHSEGSLLVVDVNVSDTEGASVVQWRAGLLLRGARKRMDVSWPDAIPKDGNGPVQKERTVVVDQSFAQRFALASRDPNPLYADDGAARMAGLPGAIVPPRALAFLAMAALEYDAPTGKHPITRFATAGARPVSIGARVIVRTHASPSGEHSITVTDDAGRILVCARAEHA
jgi:acyl dehydratase